MGSWVAPATLGARREWGCKRKGKPAKEALSLTEGPVTGNRQSKLLFDLFLLKCAGGDALSTKLETRRSHKVT